MLSLPYVISLDPASYPFYPLRNSSQDQWQYPNGTKNNFHYVIASVLKIYMNLNS